MHFLNSRKRRYGWLALAAGAITFSLVAAVYHGHFSHRASPDPPLSAGRAQLLLAVDGLSWDAFTEARRRGMFRRFKFYGRHVAPYPSMSHPSWAEIIGTPRVFGQRGNAHTIESRWLDLDAMRNADDPRQVVARQASLYNYQRAFDYFFDPLLEPLMYLRGRKLFDRELKEAEAAILSGFSGPRYVAYIGGADAMGHTHLNGYWPYMARLDSMIERVADSLDARGTPVEISLVSDHGNAGSFREGTKESYLIPVSFDGAVRRAGLVRVHSSRLERSNQVSIVTIALATMTNFYFADLSRRRGLAEAALSVPGADLATWLEVTNGDRYIVILGRGGAEARLRWRDESYAYERLRGNPLQLPDSMVSTVTERRWLPDAQWRAATVNGPYPDAPFRLVRSAIKQVENAPDLIVSLRDGYCYKGDMTRFVRMVRTHGSLTAGASLGIVASTFRPIPASVRSREVLDALGLQSDSLLSHVAALERHDPVSLAYALAKGGGRLSTGREDASAGAAFLRRARPIVVSMDYFSYDAMRELFDSLSSNRFRGREPGALFRMRSDTGRTRTVHALANNVDTLLSLMDSLDVREIPARTRAAVRRLRGISDFSQLTELPEAMTAAPARGGAGEPFRRAAMALWTLPYFLDAALAGPEQDSISDTRDFSFALDWYRKVRPKIDADPTILLDDSVTPRKLFEQVYSERRLRLSADPTRMPLLYDPDLGDLTVVYIPGIYGELFDGEIWSRGMRAVRDELGARILTIPVDGRCQSATNAVEIVSGLRADTQRRLARGYQRPRYLIVGFSKGGVDATEALLLAPDIARQQVAALVSIASPHYGTPLAERSSLPADLMRWGVTTPRAPACDTTDASRSLWPATRSAFWSAHASEVSQLTRYFSLSFVADMASAHPWMKLTKRIAEFNEPNDGVVTLTSSHFPARVHAIDLGTTDADHISARSASLFPQDAFLEAVVVTVAELGALKPSESRRWIAAVAHRENPRPRWSWPFSKPQSDQTPAFAASLRSPAPLPGGSSGWAPDKMFNTSRVTVTGANPIREIWPLTTPDGIRFRCDQRDMASFRREYEFYYDSGNGGSENDRANGFSIVPAAESRSGRACHFATQATAIKMTTASFQFRPVDFPVLSMRLRIAKNVSGVDPSKMRRGKNDAAFKLWLVLTDTRPAADTQTVMFGYWWTARNASGVSPAPGSLVEAFSSRRNVVFSTLPEAWLIGIGARESDGRWQTIQRDLAADIGRAYPRLPVNALKVVGITLQSDSDESHGESEAFVQSLSLTPRHVPLVLARASPAPKPRSTRTP
jgi:hypothetical protein